MAREDELSHRLDLVERAIIALAAVALPMAHRMSEEEMRVTLHLRDLLKEIRQEREELPPW